MTLPKISCRDCPIRHRAVCAQCDDDELAVLENIKNYRTLPKGGIIAEAGEPLEYLSSVVQGCATISKTLMDGRRQMVGLLLPSDFIGRPGRATSPFDIVAATEVTLCRFERHNFERMAKGSPNISWRLLNMTFDELEAAREWSVVLGRMNARERVAQFLLSLVRRHASDAGEEIATGAVTLHLPLSRETIADYLGLTIETTSRQFSALRRDGVVEFDTARDIFVPDVARLIDETEGDLDSLTV